MKLENIRWTLAMLFMTRQQKEDCVKGLLLLRAREQAMEAARWFAQRMDLLAVDEEKEIIQ